MNYRFRRIIPRIAKRWLRPAACLGLFSDYRSFVEFARLVGGRGGSETCDTKLVELKMRPLGGRPVAIRVSSSDAQVVFSTYFHRYHSPPAGVVPKSARRILDLGCNIGLTIADFAVQYPQAEILGVELDAANHSICHRNIQPWQSRCRLVHGAAWFEDGEVQYERHDGVEHGFSAQSLLAGGDDRAMHAKAYSVASLLESWAPNEEVDYLKMDVEGAEQQLLSKNAQWCRLVKCMNVELHGDYTAANCMADLQRWGFRVWRDGKHASSVFAVRD